MYAVFKLLLYNTGPQRGLQPCDIVKLSSAILLLTIGAWRVHGTTKTTTTNLIYLTAFDSLHTHLQSLRSCSVLSPCPPSQATADRETPMQARVAVGWPVTGRPAAVLLPFSACTTHLYHRGRHPQAACVGSLLARASPSTHAQGVHSVVLILLLRTLLDTAAWRSTAPG